mgnify:CR=1 FL=1
MAYLVEITSQQLRVIREALATAPIINEIDGMDEAVQPQLIELIDSTLQHPEDDDTIHGFAL